MRVNTLSRISLVLFIYRMGFPQGRNCTEYEGYTLRVFPLYILYVIYVPSVAPEREKESADRLEKGLPGGGRTDQRRVAATGPAWGVGTRHVTVRGAGVDRILLACVLLLVSRTSGCAVGHVFAPHYI